MSSENEKNQPIADLTLQPPFTASKPISEGALPPPSAGLASIDTLDSLPSPDNLPPTALPVPADPSNRPRLLFVDDEAEVLAALRTSAQSALGDAVDIRTWTPGASSLVAEIESLTATGWKPDLLILDINLDVGGHAGLHYLKAVREQRGLLAMPVVLATGNLLGDLDSNKLTTDQGPNKTGIEPKEWSQRAKVFEPEAILYGKQGDITFMQRLVENLPVWRQSARRRAWTRLLSDVAHLLDGAPPDLTQVGQAIAQFAGSELNVGEAFVAWLLPSKKLRLIGMHCSWPGIELGLEISPSSSSVLDSLVAANRSILIDLPVVSASEAGDLKANIEGSRLLMTNAVLDAQSVGLIALLRKADAPPFDADVDGNPLKLLARFVAAAMGRADMLSRLRARGASLLEFANDMAQAQDDCTICDKLAALVHESLHGGSDTDSEVTVRLVEFDTGEVKRRAKKGIPTDNVPLRLWDTNSVIVRAVSKGETQIVSDMQAPDVKGAVLDTGLPKGQLRSELCVPMMSGKSAIGAVNAESVTVDRYHDPDVKFLQAASALAVAAIRRNHSLRFMEDLSKFAASFADKDSVSLQMALYSTLKQFSSASAIVHLQAPEPEARQASVETPPAWSVAAVELLLAEVDQTRFKRLLRSVFEQDWAKTSVAGWVETESWVDGWCQYTAQSARPLLRDRVPNGSLGDVAEATAILWQRSDPSRPPDSALVLLWLFNPPIEGPEVKLLGLLAELLTALSLRKRQLQDYMDIAIVGEQAALLGNVVQHMRHRLKGDQNKLIGLVESMETTKPDAAATKIVSLASELRALATNMARGFSKSRNYIKAPQSTSFRVAAVVEAAVNDLANSRGHFSVKVEIASDAIAWGDADITELAVFTLMENALDATRDMHDGQVYVRHRSNVKGSDIVVNDNGPGINISVRDRLFSFGTTSKGSLGLGSGLAFSRARLRAAHGDLLWQPESKEKADARFVIHLPGKDSSDDKSQGEQP